MTPTALNRELITLDGQGILFRGTYHLPSPTGRAGEDSLPGSRGRIGLLFMNSFSTPRASFGDTAVAWASAFAACGFPSFRFDLPGLGDTTGETPADLLDFINRGGYASSISFIAKSLEQRYGLSGIVLVGHCAGAITALYAASTLKECKGLILMDPYFHLASRLREKIPVSVVDWTKRSKTGRIVGAIHVRLRKAWRKLRENSPPENANRPLLACWKQVASKGLPILILRAPVPGAAGTNPRPGQFDYLKHILGLAGRGAQVSIQLIEDTDHCFSNHKGRAAVQEEVDAWLCSHFVAVDQEALQPETLCFAASATLS